MSLYPTRRFLPDARGKEETAAVFLTRGQKLLFGGLLLAALLYGLPLIGAGPQALLRLLMTLTTTFYVAFFVVKATVSIAGAGYKFPPVQVPSIHDPNLPTYSLLVPMRNETAEGFSSLLDWLARIEYPTKLLQILFIVDEDDKSTINIVNGRKLPSYMRLIENPTIPGAPTTKPQACNYAMNFVTGKRLAIYDFEDKPVLMQLLKAVATMNYWRLRDETVACVQGMLQFMNPRFGRVSAFYWAEYVVHFRWMLTGLARLGLVPPLGGTSNHFLTSALWEVAKQYGEDVYIVNGQEIRVPRVWDSWNVTEDADLAMRLKRCGYSVKMGDFVTYESAPDTFAKAAGQRSRWLKGFLFTFLVQSRKPFTSMREVGVVQYLVYNLFIGGTPISFLINPIMWATTLLYIVSRLANWGSVTLFIEALFPTPLHFYAAIGVAFFGNLLPLFQMLITPLQQQEHESFKELPPKMQQQAYGLSTRLLCGLVIWWIFTTYPAYVGFLELFRKATRWFWNKTKHDTDPEEQAMLSDGNDAVAALPSGRHRPGRVGDAQTLEQDKIR